jgi:hypothetical protein
MIKISHQIESNAFQRFIVQRLVIQLATAYTFLKDKDNARSKAATNNASRHVVCNPLRRSRTKQINTRSLSKLNATTKRRSCDLSLAIVHVGEKAIHLWPTLYHELSELWRHNTHRGVVGLHESSQQRFLRDQLRRLRDVTQLVDQFFRVVGCRRLARSPCLSNEQDVQVWTGFPTTEHRLRDLYVAPEC